MKWLNKFNLPETIVRGAMRQNAKYDKGNSDRSVTQLIAPPRMDILRKKHFSEIEKDISEEWWALFGSAVHYILELGIDHQQTPEERLFLDVNGWTISGAIDLQTPIEGGIRISDYKVTTAYPLTKTSGKIEWEQQLNMQAYLVEANKGIKVKELEIVAIVRDWDRKKAAIELNYPAAPIIPVPIELWSREEQEKFILDRVAIHQMAEMSEFVGEELPECTSEERWVRGDKWSVKKPANKRATRTFDNEEEATEFAATGDYEIIFEPGTSMRCGFCGVSSWCTQYARMQEAKDE